MSARFGLSPAAELSEETLIIDCGDSAEVLEEPPALKKKSSVLTKSNDSAAKGAIHPSGSKFINSRLWKHYKLSPRSDCDKWGLCVVCQKAGDITWVSRVDGSTTRMKKHLLEAHNCMYHICMLRAVDRFALSIDCSARTIDYRLRTNLSIAQPPMDRATIDRLCSKQLARSIEIHVNSNALAQSIDSARVRIGAKAWCLDCFAFQCAVSYTRIVA